MKDYFGAQGIIHFELRTKKLLNSGMNPWKNRLKKWNSYEKEQLINSNYQNAKAPLLLLQNEKENLIKNHKYEVLSYKFLFHEDTKDSYSYRIPFQGNKNKEFSYTNNYNIYKGNLINMWWSIPITYYLNIMDIEKNSDRKYFDWKIIHFDHLRKKGRIGAWIRNKCTKIEPKNYQLAYEFDTDDEIIIDEKEKEIDEKEKKECFADKNDIFCHKIYQKLNRSLNRSHQKKNLFDWMEMNEEILSRLVSIESWFFPEFVLLYNVYKIKPWTIPINLLFSEFENFSVNEKKNEKRLSNRLEYVCGGSRRVKQYRPRGDLNLDLMVETGVTPMKTLLKEGIIFTEPIRLSKIDVQFIIYQTIGISWVYKSKKRPT
ncbi:hypothetical protein Cgig2_032236 [Carnegiea gigantea]|uniref:Ycf1 n=1 Tax=Carnegiea gigantea TaxID=171969 RepID=A0A9Q1JLX2_9CARY|nr:hypothetical protein Cgig2_032236 [Carnegiea gigantea]